jgi:hypothetical protein
MSSIFLSTKKQNIDKLSAHVQKIPIYYFEPSKKYSSRVTIPHIPFKAKTEIRKMLPVRRNNFKTRFKGNF